MPYHALALAIIQQTSCNNHGNQEHQSQVYINIQIEYNIKAYHVMLKYKVCYYGINMVLLWFHYSGHCPQGITHRYMVTVTQ